MVVAVAVLRRSGNEVEDNNNDRRQATAIIVALLPRGLWLDGKLLAALVDGHCFIDVTLAIRDGGDRVRHLDRFGERLLVDVASGRAAVGAGDRDLVVQSLEE